MLSLAEYGSPRTGDTDAAVSGELQWQAVLLLLDRIDDSSQS